MPFIVDEQGNVIDRNSPEQRKAEQAEFAREMDERAFQRWGRENGMKVYRLGLFFIMLGVCCFMEAWYVRTTSVSWLWGFGGALLVLVGLPMAGYGLKIM